MKKKPNYVDVALAYGFANIALGYGTYRLFESKPWTLLLWLASALWSVRDYAQDVNQGRTSPPHGWAVLPAQSTSMDVLRWSWHEVVTMLSAWAVVWGLWFGEAVTALLGLVGGVVMVLVQRDFVRRRHDALLP